VASRIHSGTQRRPGAFPKVCCGPCRPLRGPLQRKQRAPAAVIRGSPFWRFHMEDVANHTVDRLGARGNHVRVLHAERNRDTVVAAEALRATVATLARASRLRPGLPCCQATEIPPGICRATFGGLMPHTQTERRTPEHSTNSRSMSLLIELARTRASPTRRQGRNSSPALILRKRLRVQPVCKSITLSPHFRRSEPISEEARFLQSDCPRALPVESK